MTMPDFFLVSAIHPSPNSEKNRVNLDGLVKSPDLDDHVKSSICKALHRMVYRAEQRRRWTFYEVVNLEKT
jgi:hypothetical protein